MDHNLLVLLTLLVGMVAAALIVQAAALYGIYRKSADLYVKLNEFMPKAEALLKNADKSLTETHTKVVEITTNANELLVTAKGHMSRADVALTDAGERAKIQMAKAELVLDSALDKVNSTVNTVHKGIITPIREVTGVAAGLRAAFSSFLGSQRPSVPHATHDEEMFI